jgi:hypothetical protein
MSAVFRLDPAVVDRNAAVERSSARRRMTMDTAEVDLEAMSGTIHLGVNEAEVRLAPGQSGSIRAVVDFVVPSVTASTFDRLHEAVAGMLDRSVATALDKAAGLVPGLGAPVAGRMAEYVRCLLDLVLPGGVVAPGDAGSRFDTAHCVARACRPVISVIRSLPVARLELSGTLDVVGGPGHPPTATASVPVTVVGFDDGYTVPFAGYSDNLTVSLASTPVLVAVPAECWATIA